MKTCQKGSKRFIKERKTKKIKRYGGGMNNKNSYILYEDNDVCILKPDAPYGILIFTQTTTKDVCSEGLYSYNELMKVKPELGLKSQENALLPPNHNNLIFFRAPYNSDISSFESTYGGNPSSLIFKKNAVIATLRIDPDKTFVYSSELRIVMGDYEEPEFQALIQSRVPLKKYLKTIEENKMVKYREGKKIRTNLINYEKQLINEDIDSEFPYIDNFPIERNTEIVVNLPHIPHTWLVGCFHNDNNNHKNNMKK